MCVAEQIKMGWSTKLLLIGGTSVFPHYARRIELALQNNKCTTTEDYKMKNMKIATTLIAALMMTTVVGCASTSTDKHETPGQYIGDAAVTTAVKAAIVKEPTLKVAEINVETYQGVVQLSGFVSSAENIATATSVARSVNGVKSVKNDLRLK